MHKNAKHKTQNTKETPPMKEKKKLKTANSNCNTRSPAANLLIIYCSMTRQKKKNNKSKKIKNYKLKKSLSPL